ncbi:sulfatase-like hydrolase/transferase [Chloroflexi bacterium TSY]|nr:sulfatase-like hydrolase/transferase [Chloroflexi bacterium TSY]
MNVIVIMNDTFRRDYLGCYGNTWIHTPNLDEFAQRAAVFEQYYIASYPTVPARWDLCTGRYGFPFRGWQPLGPNDLTLAQILAQNNIHTQMIWDTPMLGTHDYNYTRGFKGLEFVRGQKGDWWITDPQLPVQQPSQPHKVKNIASLDSYLRNHFNRQYEREYCSPRTLSAAMDWLESNHTHDSFFLWIDMWDPHEPFDCPIYDYARYAAPTYQGDQMLYPQYGRPTYMSDAERQNARALYAGNVTLVDRWMGKFLHLAERLGLFKNTLIIWISDHGHLFGEHDLQGKPGAELGTLYEITARVPMIVYHPEGVGAGTRVSGLVQPVDLFPSVLDFMDLPIPHHVQGQSFWPLVAREKSTLRDYAFSSRFPPTAGDASYVPVQGAVFDGWVGSDRIVEPSTVTSDEWAFLCAPQGGPSELYNLQSDPAQMHNVIDQHPEIARQMKKAWLEFLEAHGAPETRVRPFVDGNLNVATPTSGKLYAFRDDQNQRIAFASETAARRSAYREDAPGPRRQVEEVSFGALLDENPKNLIYLYGQFYWAEDLA